MKKFFHNPEVSHFVTPVNIDPHKRKKGGGCKTKKILLAIPGGNLFDEVQFLLLGDNRTPLTKRNREYFVEWSNKIDLVILRAEEIPRYVLSQEVDAGITGLDWFQEKTLGLQNQEHASHLRTIATFDTSRKFTQPKWVIAVSEDSEIQSTRDLHGKMVTRMPSLTASHLSCHPDSFSFNRVEIERSSGTCEAKVPRFAQSCCVVSVTGKTIQRNNLRVIDTVMESHLVSHLLSSFK
jgi:ATP phosphoribosyltransferase